MICPRCVGISKHGVYTFKTNAACKSAPYYVKDSAVSTHRGLRETRVRMRTPQYKHEKNCQLHPSGRKVAHLVLRQGGQPKHPTKITRPQFEHICLRVYYTCGEKKTCRVPQTAPCPAAHTCQLNNYCQAWRVPSSSPSSSYVPIKRTSRKLTVSQHAVLPTRLKKVPIWRGHHVTTSKTTLLRIPCELTTRRVQLTANPSQLNNESASNNIYLWVAN